MTVTAEGGKPVTGVFVDVSRIRHDMKSWGDTWDHIWADEDNLYTFGCDGGGCGAQNNNLNFNKLTGSVWDQLAGSPVNSMSEYGKNGSYLADNSTQLLDRTWSIIPHGPNWKVTGADCIDGAFYAFVAQNWYGNQKTYGGNALDPYLRQTVNNMSLIKSTDKGLTWTRTMTENAGNPMWTNKMFSTAYFFKYGQNGGNTRQDEQDQFVYAVSNIIYGERIYKIARLKESMTELAEEPKEIKIVRTTVFPETDKNSLHKYNGVYYLSCSGYYATSQNIYGPYETKGAVGKGFGIDTGYGHGDFFTWKGDWYHVWCRYRNRSKDRVRDCFIAPTYYTENGAMYVDLRNINEKYKTSGID